MKKSKGVLVFARNNGHIDYVEQAVFLAKRVRKYLDLPTSIVTDSVNYLESTFGTDVFDKIIPIDYVNDENHRLYFDGSLTQKTANFKNRMRSDAYDVSPYDETLLLDSDMVICNDMFKSCFDSKNDFLIYQKSEDIAKVRNEIEFHHISDYGIDFYWATCIFFRKTEENKTFFDLVKHIQEKWEHYYRTYQLESSLFRNDFAFSIAIHIMNGFQKGSFAAPMPGKLLYTIDKDILWKVKDDELLFLVEKKDYIGEYTPIRTKGQTIHVMNKFSLSRLIGELDA
jgi:hypothetical protein